MEVSEINPREFKNQICPKDNILKVFSLAEEAVKSYRESKGEPLGYFLPKGVTREHLKRAIIIASLYKAKDDVDFVEEVMKKLKEVGYLG